MTDPIQVYRGMSQQELDSQYNNRARFPDYVDHFNRWTEWSQATRERLPCQLDVEFGRTLMEKIDIFPAEAPGAPIYVFIHGGYWYSLDKSHYSYVAEGMRPHGVTTVVNNFGLAPDHDMDTIVAHNRKVIAWLWRNAESFGADRDRIYVCGHSAGGHLGLMLLGTDWQAFAPDLPTRLVKGVCSIGGIHDLEPIALSFLNEKLKMSAQQASRNSPIRLSYRHKAPLSLVVAIDESAEFHRQSQEIYDFWIQMGYPATLLVPPGLDHFSVVNDLADPACLLVRHQLEQMKIAFSS